MRLKRLAALVLAGAICLTSLVGCGVKPEETAATLGDTKVTAGLVNFICKYQKAGVDDTYVTYFGENFWNQDLYGYGTTMEDDIKASIMNAIHELYTVKAHVADYKVELTDDEKAAITKLAKAFMDGNSEAAIKEMGATEEIVAEMLTLYTIQAKMYDAIVAGADHEVKDEDANMRGITLVEINIEGKYNDKGSFVKYTEEEVKGIKLVAQKIANDAVKDGIDKAAKDNKYTAEDTAYNKNDKTMDATLLKALNELKVGEPSKLIETKSALYIAKIDEDVDKKATEENRKAIIKERESKFYSEKLKEWQKDDGWKVNTSVLDKIDFHHILTQKDPNAKDTEKNTEKVDSSEKGTEKVETTEGK